MDDQEHVALRMDDQEHVALSVGLSQSLSLPWASVSLWDVNRGTGTLAFASIWNSVFETKHLSPPLKETKAEKARSLSQEVMLSQLTEQWAQMPLGVLCDFTFCGSPSQISSWALRSRNSPTCHPKS